MDFSVFLDERQVALLRLAILLCGSRVAGEDVLQDVLVRAYQQWSRISIMESPYGYVRTMVVNEHLSWRRRSVRQIPHAEIDPGTRPDHAEGIAVRDDLVRRVDALPTKQRTAVILRYFADLDDAEIAQALACEPVTVRSYVSRGLAALRVDLGTTSSRPGARTVREDLR